MATPHTQKNPMDEERFNILEEQLWKKFAQACEYNSAERNLAAAKVAEAYMTLIKDFEPVKQKAPGQTL